MAQARVVRQAQVAQEVQRPVEQHAGPGVAAAIVDRLLHYAAVLNIRGRSYRLRAHQDAPVPPAPAGRKGDAATVP